MAFNCLHLINIYLNKLHNWKLLRSKIINLCLCVLCLFCYGHALHGSFLFDDWVAIVRNPSVTQIPTNYTAILYNDFWGTRLTSNESHKSYRPLTTLMFHWEYAKAGLTAVQMKCINLMLHMINTLLVWHVLKSFEFIKNDCHLTAILASIIFAIHPIHTEAVCGIVSRADLMFALIYLLSLLLTIHNCPAITIIILTAIGMLFKESSITIPLACLLFEYARKHFYRLTLKEQFISFCNIRTITYVSSVSILLLLRLWWSNFTTPQFQYADNPVAHAAEFRTRALTQNYLYAKSLMIQLEPSSLSFDWAFDCIQLIRNFSDPRLLAVFSLYGLLLMAIANYRSNFAAILGIGLYVIPYLPATGIIQVGFVIAERILYVPSIGFCYLVAHGYSKLLDTALSPLCRLCLKLGLTVTLIMLMLRCRQRSMEWLAEDVLYTSALKVCPNNAKVHYNIARLASDSRNRSKALYHYHRAIELYPKYDAACMNLGNLYREMGDLKKAEEYLEKSVNLTPNLGIAWMNLGIVYSNQRKFQQASISYHRALELRPNYANCHYNLGNMYLDENQPDKALYHWQRALELKPSLVKAWMNLLTLLDSMSNYKEVLQISQKALMLHPNSTDLILLRANVLGKLAYYEDAERLYKLIISKEPFNYLYHTNLGVLYHRWQQPHKAVQHYKLAIEADAKKATTAQRNLNRLIRQLNKDKS